MKRYAVVTGGADGLGWTVTGALLTRGWEVVLADIDGSRARERAATDERLGAIALDVSDGAAVAAAFAALEAERGPLGLLVNNAGIHRPGRIEDLPDDDWRAVIGVDLDGAFYCLKAAGKQMLAAGGGVIVNTVSVAAERGVPGRSPYACAKAGLVALTRSAAVEWAGRGVRVNAVGPGYVETALLRGAIDTGRLVEADIVDRIPAGRIATPGEIAEVVCFLASDAASYVNGQTLYVDGGFLADYGVGSR
jgi:3-oxoacyl-[acyl-carrier protein] reductase